MALYGEMREAQPGSRAEESKSKINEAEEGDERLYHYTRTGNTVRGAEEILLSSSRNELLIKNERETFYSHALLVLLSLLK